VNKFGDFDEYEIAILSSLVVPSDIDTSFDDIGGLQEIKDSIRQAVILPLLRPDIFQQRGLLGTPKGILLHGPPGTGKTMLAKALAKESKSVFLNIQKSDVSSKWYGDPSKLVNAVFSVANKLQPCVIFIDEMEAMFRTRDSLDHEATLAVKCQFMAMWDGLLSSDKSAIVVIGATNRPQDIDPAILRRMPKVFQVPTPSEQERRGILTVILKRETIASDVTIEELARMTPQYTGSELKSMCRLAAEFGLKDFLVEEDRCRRNNLPLPSVQLRAIYREDFRRAIAQLRLQRQQQEEANRAGPNLFGFSAG